MSNGALRMGGAEWALLLFLSVLWGCSFFFFKVLGHGLAPFTIVFGRVGLAAIALRLVVAARGGRARLAGRQWGAICILAAFNNVLPFSCFAWAETRITSGLASVLNATTPVFAVVAAHVFTRGERLTPARAVGVGLGVLGVVILVGPETLHLSDARALPAEGACLVAALSYALCGIYGRRFREIPALELATAQVTAGALLIAPLSLIVDHPWTLPPPSLGTIGALLGIALFSTALAFIIYFRILAVAGATNLMLVTLLSPITALALGVAVLGEPLTLRAVLGMAVIGAGLLAIDGRLAARLRSSRGAGPP